MTPRPHPHPDSAKVDLIHERSKIDQAVKDLLAALGRHGYSESSTFAVRLAVEEALANAFRHGNKGKPDDTPVRLEWAVSPGRVRVIVQDRGSGFDPASVPDPTLDENLEMPSGRGLMLMRAYMTSVGFNDAGNRVEMTYAKPA
jgi:serine/threonine-protein kinase RsbW